MNQYWYIFISCMKQVLTESNINLEDKVTSPETIFRSNMQSPKFNGKKVKVS